MKMVEALMHGFERSFPSQIAVLLIVSVLFWAVGVPTMVKPVKAAYMSAVSDTLSHSDNGSLAAHTVQFTNSTSTKAGDTIVVTADPAGGSFVEYYSTASSSDILLLHNGVQLTQAASCGTNVYTVAATNYNTGTNEGLTFTLCPSTTIAAGETISIQIGTTTASRLWQNPNAGPDGASYRITIGGTAAASGETRVAVLPHITLTATVNTTFTFTVTPVPSGNTVGGDLLTQTSSTTTIPFGTLASGTPQIVAQRLNVTTNAQNGFAVTVQEDQPMTANSGSLIYLFKDGATTTVPTAWTHPTATLNAYQTYGHLGITSTDADLNSNEFSNATLYAGNIITPRVVFSHNGPTNGITNNQGSTTVAYKIESTDLLPAGTYTNQVQYVATPTF